MPSIPSPDAEAPIQPTGPRRRRWNWLRWTLGLVLAAWSVLLAAWLILQWGILPRIESWRPQIEARATQALGVPVRIGNIVVTSSGWKPTIELREVRLIDPQDRAGGEALRLPRVVAALSPTSILRLQLHFDRLLIEGAQVEVRRDAQGRLHIAGIDFSGSDNKPEDDGSAADWFFSQGEFEIRGGSLSWVDEMRGAQALSLRDVDLVVRNRPGLGQRHHDLRLDATPPASWGERFSLRGRFTQALFDRHGLVSPGQWRSWRGTSYAELPSADVQELRRHVDLPFELMTGHGGLRAWIDWRRGEPVAATVDLGLRDVALRLAGDVEPLSFSRIDGRVSGERRSDEASLAAKGLSFTTGDGVVWPAGDFTLRWRVAKDGTLSGGELNAQRLDLAVLAQIASRVPLGEPLRRALGELQPRGLVGPLTARWDGPLDALQRYRVQGKLSGLSIAAQALPPGWSASAPAAQVAAATQTTTTAVQAQAAAAPTVAASAAQPGHWIGRPGLSNADIELTATEQGGEARLSLARGALEFPGVFEEPVIAFDRLSSQLNWRIYQPRRDAARQVELKVSNARFANADAEGELNATWSTGPGNGTGAGQRLPGVIDLNGKLGRARVAAVARYLPLGIPEATRRYVRNAALAGNASAVNFKVKGDLWDFPYGQAAPAVAAAVRGTPSRTPPPKGAARAAAPNGDFRVAARIENATFAYMPGEPAAPTAPPRSEHAAWPVFTQLKGELIFDRQAMEIRNAQGRLGTVGGGGFEVYKVNGGIANLADNATLAIAGQGRGPLADGLAYLKATPISGWLHHALDDASSTGNAELQLALNIPLNHADDTTVKGSVQLTGNDVRLRPDMPVLGAARAQVNFAHDGFAVLGGRARVLGGDMSFDGGQPPGGVMRFSAQGTASAEGLRRASQLGALSQLATQMSGQTSYQLKLAFPQGHAQVDFTSSLVGLALDLPAPLRKPAEQPMPLQVHSSLLSAAASEQAPRDQWRIELGSLLQAHYTRDLAGEQPRVLRGGIGVGEAAPTPAQGVAANLSFASLHVEAWEAVLAKLQAPAGGAATTATGTAASALPPAADDSYMPDHVALRVQELLTHGRKLTHVVAGLSQDDGLWRANVEADQLAGYAEYRSASHAGGAGRVYARLTRLSLPKSEVEAVETLLDQSPASLPALDIVVDDFELRGKRLGRVEIEAVNRGAEASPREAREWRLAKLNFATPEARFSASGTWGGAAGVVTDATAARGSNAPRRRAVMDFKLDLTDSGAFLTRLGLPGTLRGGKGRLAGQVSWLGSPLSPDYPSLGGNVNVAIDAGQFLKADAGAAKLLSVLSLQSLPRRLLFDFRDLFQEGFSFDNVGGDVAIANGVATTRNLRMRGVQAVVLMEGQADIARESQNLRVWVVPEINAGAASLAYAVINPAIGLGTFLGQMFLRRPLIEAGTREFKVTGSWSDPKVERVERKSGDAMPELDPPAPAASAASR